jgi:uncharacterized membrane protein
MADIDPLPVPTEKKDAVSQRLSLVDALPGLGVAFCFSISAILVRNGLNAYNSPLMGVTIGIVASVLGYAPWLWWISRRRKFAPVSRSAVFYQALAGVLIGLGTWARYIATDLTEIGVVLALGRINTPMVLLLSPLFFGRVKEPVNLQVWIGAGLIVAGSLVTIFWG